MTTEELLKPRYKCISDYPMSRIKIGEIIEPWEVTEWHPSQFPSIFELLQWWEHRDEQTILNVRFVKTNTPLHKGQVHDMERLTALYGYMSGVRDSFVSKDQDSYGNKIFELRYFEPSTEEEYLRFISYFKNK